MVRGLGEQYLDTPWVAIDSDVKHIHKGLHKPRNDRPRKGVALADRQLPQIPLAGNFNDTDISGLSSISYIFFTFHDLQW